MKLTAVALLTLGSVGVVGSCLADSASDAEISSWINRMSGAAQQLCYVGTFVRESQGQMESLRVAHYVEGKEEYEKVEFLDGPEREVIRLNEEVAVYLPGSKTIKLVQRKARRFFPALLSSNPDVYAENYTITMGPTERVAGHDCRGLLFEPKDQMRYSRWFCAEQQSGLILKTSLKDERGVKLEQMAFTQLIMGRPQVKREHVKPSYPDAKQRWHTDIAPLDDLVPAESGWAVMNPPSGFRKVHEMKRVMPNKTVPIFHQVLSDGLASVSIFIEPLLPNTKPPLGPSHQGAVNTYIAATGENLITVMGEVPGVTVQQIAQTLKPQAK
jgi:sigma-E factor negative regulatory protein RseB